MDRLVNKRAVITGGSGGIGTATAKRFLEEGASVLLVDIAEDKLSEAAQKLGSDRVFTFKADVTKSDEVKAYVDAAVEKMGGIEGVVKPITDYPEEVFMKVLGVNVVGVWLGLKYVMPVMQQNGGGSIIITSSVAGIQGTPNVSAYVTSKHGTVGLMKVAALEGAAQKIRVNSIHPSPVDNRMMRSLEEGFAPGSGQQAQQQFAQAIPMQRYASEVEVANLVVFLASDDASFINGGQYSVDGGQSAL